MSYIGTSMSENAVKAYEHDEKPLSKINKDDVDKVKSFLVTNYDLSPNTKITIKRFKEYLKTAGRSSWHHTGLYFNETNFYNFSYNISDGKETNIENLRKQDVNEEKLNQFILFINKKIERKNNRTTIDSQQEEYYFAEVELGQWKGSRSKPKLVTYRKHALIKGKFAYILDSNQKKFLSGSHINIKKTYTSQIPKHFSASKANIILENLHLKE